jgi:hypothetical protein
LSIIELAADDEVAITVKEEKLAEIMEMDQGLLQCMGVSHYSKENVSVDLSTFVLFFWGAQMGRLGCSDISYVIPQVSDYA